MKAARLVELLERLVHDLPYNGISENHAAMAAFEVANAMMDMDEVESDATSPAEDPIYAWCDKTSMRVWGMDFETLSSTYPTN